MSLPTPAPARRLSRAERNRLAQRLRRVLRGDVLFDAAARGRYATDASPYRVQPAGVVLPADEADLIAAMALARELEVPVVPRGGGSSQGGQALGEGLVIDTSRHLNRILAFDPQARTVVVQPGLVLDSLNAQLASAGLCFPVDIGSAAQATLGGMVANNASGLRSIADGDTVHHVLAIDALLADGTGEQFGPFGVGATRALRSGRTGAIASQLFQIAARERDEIERLWPRRTRRVGGYNLDVFHPVASRPYSPDASVNLAHVLVGSEGTLAQFLRLHLRLAPLPAQRVLAALRFASLGQALAAVPDIAAQGPSALELLDGTMIAPLRAVSAFRQLAPALLDGRPSAVLLVEFTGDDRAALLRQLRLLGDVARGGGRAITVLELPDAAAQRLVWQLHRAVLQGLRGPAVAAAPAWIVDDCAVPLAHLPDYVSEMGALFARQGVRGVWHGHAGAGCLRLAPDPASAPVDPGRWRALADEAGALVQRLRGAFSAGHGDGLARSEWLERDYGPRLARAFQEIKTLFDPHGLMNPGKIVQPRAFDDPALLRAGRRLPVAPDCALAWPAATAAAPTAGAASAVQSPPPGAGATADGFVRALAACDGGGACRALDTGAMCPSFRVTRSERDAPRGRTSTLRLALEGRFGPQGLASGEVADAMALCVSCKACRSECPSGIDVARMKLEVSAQRVAAHGASAADRLLARLPALAPHAARLAWLANLRDRLPGARALSTRIFDLAPRPLPRWTRKTFTRSWQPLPPAGALSSATEVALFADCFGNHFDAPALQAAQRVLTAAGLSVELARPAPQDAEPRRPLCCGRSYLSAGFPEQARAEAQRTVAALAPLLDRAVEVVGLEPACLLTMRDEFRAMGLGDAAERLAGGARLFEESLVALDNAGRLALPWQPTPWRAALLQPHCHQQAFDLVPTLQRVLGWIPGLDLRVAPAGCCGMGDGFGYRASTHPVSMRMAELGLLPAVRAAGPQAVIIADGFGCRRQVADGSGREALHSARVLEAALPD